MLPIFASLLPGVLSAGKKIISGVAKDLASGKGLGSSLKYNIAEGINSVIPGGTAILSGLLGKKAKRKLLGAANRLDMVRRPMMAPSIMEN